MHRKKRWTAEGFEQKAAALRSSAREIRVEQLQMGINPGGTKIVRSKRDKANCPRAQRKNKSWQKEMS